MKLRNRWIVTAVAVMISATLTVATAATVLAANEVDGIYAYWTTSATDMQLHPAAGPGANALRETDDHPNLCTGTKHFRLYWLPPRGPGGILMNAQEWESDITLSGGASNVTHSFHNDPDYTRPEMRGSVRLDSFSHLSIKVRGKFNDVWADWSSPNVTLSCHPQVGGL